jgi:integrase
MKKNGRAETTIQTMLDNLTRLSRLCNIDDPENVKTFIANQTWQTNTKRNVAWIYAGYLKFIGKTWTMPEYQKQSGLAFIPTETELDALIINCKPRTSALLQLLKETGARLGEAIRITWKDIDTERRTVYITAEKGSNSRILPISPKLINIFNTIPHDKERLFPATIHSLETTIYDLRKRTATRLSNPRLLNIHFHTFRHWKGTMEYHKTKDIVHVQAVLGHKDIKTTMIYINLENALYHTENDEWTSLVTHSITEEEKAIQVGFTLVRSINETTALYRKRK